jgi:hypothetical protein
LNATPRRFTDEHRSEPPAGASEPEMRRATVPLACLLLLAAYAQPVAAATKKERQRICAKRGFTYASSKVARVFRG